MASFKGKAAPAIPVLQDQNGNDFDLSALYGKEALCVFFYPQATQSSNAMYLEVIDSAIFHQLLGLFP